MHGLPAAPTHTDTVHGYPRQVWRDAAGREAIESFTIASMAHGTPLATAGDNAYGAAGPFLLEVGISSTYHIAKFWGLTDKAFEARPAEAEMVWARGAVAVPAAAAGAELALASHDSVAELARAPAPAPAPAPDEQPLHVPAGAERPSERHNGYSRAIDIQAIIDKALRAAGLKS